MSTKTPISDAEFVNSKSSYEIYTDWIDECAGLDVVNVKFEGVSFEASSHYGKPYITLALPREMAESLNLIEAKTDRTD